MFNRPGSGGWWNASDVMMWRLLSGLCRSCGVRTGTIHDRSLNLDARSVVEAHGAWIALLASVLEREGVVPSGELARVLREFAELTAIDRPAEGRILSLWAATLQATAEGVNDLPSLH